MPEPAHKPRPAVLEQIATTVAARGRCAGAREYGRARSVAVKSSPTDVVTQTGRDAAQLIRRALRQATPEARILG